MTGHAIESVKPVFAFFALRRDCLRLIALDRNPGELVSKTAKMHREGGTYSKHDHDGDGRSCRSVSAICFHFYFVSVRRQKSSLVHGFLENAIQTQCQE